MNWKDTILIVISYKSNKMVTGLNDPVVHFEMHFEIVLELL